MFESFKEFNFHESTRVLISEANEIIREYSRDGLTLTLRQLYYQFVARGLLENNQKASTNLAKRSQMHDWPGW